ncbi:hypothetical protein BGW41_007052 [Actinomortierella wolfii]|nr:hypothetical protein BGW41_007052 [Actinomortierella wolfii]
MPVNSRTRARRAASTNKETAANNKSIQQTAPPKTTRATRSSRRKAVAEVEEEEGTKEQEEQSKEEEEEEKEGGDLAEEEKQETETSANPADDSDEETFKIHTPKQTTTNVSITKLTTPKWEDEEDDDSDSDAAPEAVSLSSSKEQILNKQDKEKAFLAKVQADQKAKRRARDELLKQQKEKAKQKAQDEEAEAVPESESQATTRSGLPTLLPMDILESVAEMDNGPKPQPVAGQKRKMHMRPEDFALLELELEMKKEARERKKLEKVQRNAGPVTVKVLNQSNLPQGQAIPETIIDFRKQHFYGNKIQRKDAILNLSQRNAGAASQFRRRR